MAARARCHPEARISPAMMSSRESAPAFPAPSCFSLFSSIGYRGSHGNAGSRSMSRACSSSRPFQPRGCDVSEDGPHPESRGAGAVQRNAGALPWPGRGGALATTRSCLETCLRHFFVGARRRAPLRCRNARAYRALGDARLDEKPISSNRSNIFLVVSCNQAKALIAPMVGFSDAITAH